MDAAPVARPTPFSWRSRVYWEDTDAGGVVYHASYLRFLERARSEWLRGVGIGQDDLRQQTGVLFVVRELEIAYAKPARLDDQLDTSVRLLRLRAASMDIAQQVARVADGVMLARATLRVACITASDWTPCRVPPSIAALIQTEVMPA